MKKLIWIFFVLIVFLFAAENSFACSCGAVDEPVKKQIQNAFTGSQAVFSGEVVEIKDSPTDQYGFIVKFKIGKSWKGAASREMMITTAKNSAMCGFNFEIGKTYLVYAFGKSDSLSTTICSRTAPLGKKSDAKYLDKLKRKAKS